MPTLTESHVKGAAGIPLIELTIGAMLDQAMARWPDLEAIVVPGWRKEQRCAAGEQSIGCRLSNGTIEREGTT